MHEFGLCQSILEAVQRRAAGRPVTEVRLRIGALHRVQDEAMNQAFAFAATGTVAQNARVAITTMPVRMNCDSCAAQAQGTELLPACPQCAGTSLTLVGGDELMLESIRLAAGVHQPANDPIHESGDGHTHVPSPIGA
ncbi:putative hydrogenase nickel incorporation protein HypA [Rhizocola hellebori]|uniref:Hydrogenase maturation factor HypA n=1 Tax=Rhizocola hellebori TaxID=1392758 RepID=A0A8J3Q6I3_9ACTN|nr:hydrogenase maturation nickel metallochaperone HypA [Rhizocola hellebori]GIH04859.1 putative hydrogenase nickel incorporation protein HypA [Rhizocola hellebori]